jgi:hypothetical protein
MTRIARIEERIPAILVILSTNVFQLLSEVP